ncbi:TPA: SPJ_0845 family protein [Streptococcus suis]
MAVTYKRQDDLEAMLSEFASFEELEKVEFPDPKTKKVSNPVTEKADDK